MATGTITSAGIGSGLDVAGIVSSLMAVERQPLTKLQSVSQNIATQISAYGQLQSGVSQLQDAVSPLIAATTFAATTSTSSDSSVGIFSSTIAAPGSYSINVTALASAQSVVSRIGQFLSATAPVGTGTLTIQPNKAGSTPISITIGAADNTLTGVRDKINAANAGVTATLVTDASGTRLSIQSTLSGVDNGFTISAADDDTNNTDNAGLSRLTYDGTAASQLALAQPAANSAATINGIPVSSANNTLDSVITGLTFTLNKLTAAGSPTVVNVTRNTDSIKTKLAAFVAAYNQLNTFLTENTKYDAAAKQGALLQGDGTTVGIQNQLHAEISQSTKGSSVFKTLSSLGVQIQKDGTLKLDDTQFTAAIANLPEVTKALSNVDATQPLNNGIAKTLYDWAGKLLASNGAIPGKTTSLQARAAANQKDQDRLNDRLTAVEASLKAKYSALDSTMSNANALSKLVTQQITTWNKSTA